MHKILFPLVLLLLAVTQFARAEEVRYYDIELIIFESLDTAARQSENWKSDINRPIPELAIELDKPYPGPLSPQYDPKLTFKPLAQSELQLLNEEKQLTDSRQYRILLHSAWRQPGLEAAVALPVHLNRSFISDTPVQHSVLPADPNMPRVNLPLPVVATQTRTVLDGYIKIILSRYLHADVDLVYSTGLPLAPQTVVANPAMEAPMTQPIFYRLTESRRMRSKEIHYLDHPVLGILLLVTPYEGKVTTQKPKTR